MALRGREGGRRENKCIREGEGIGLSFDGMYRLVLNRNLLRCTI